MTLTTVLSGHDLHRPLRSTPDDVFLGTGVRDYRRPLGPVFVFFHFSLVLSDGYCFLLPLSLSSVPSGLMSPLGDLPSPLYSWDFTPR